ncbi:ras-related protein Rab-14-like isoform 2-T2 [Salvelinus alpinus]
MHCPLSQKPHNRRKNPVQCKQPSWTGSQGRYFSQDNLQISSEELKTLNRQFPSHDGHRTVQLLLHFQIHHHRGHGGREVMFASPVHREEMRSTYNHLSSWLTDARNLTNPNTVIILIGNKADLEAQRDVTYEEAKQFAEENGLLFLEASAKTGENVEDAFLEAAKKIYQNIQDGSLDLNAAESGVQHKPSAPQGGRLITNEPQPQREGCGC